jgi:hypothetical protein
VNQRPAHPQRGDDDEGQLADRERAADEREATLDVREAELEAGIKIQQTERAERADRTEAARGILANADQRDERADDRDAVADKREKDASLVSFMEDADDYGSAHKARRSSAVDRSASKEDRASSADDRSELTKEVPPDSHHPG